MHMSSDACSLASKQMLCLSLEIIVQEKNRALKYGGGLAVLVALGTGIPIFAAWFQIQKAKT
jgi:hypothetical protein